jgi:DNA replication and repair protein RecF
LNILSVAIREYRNIENLSIQLSEHTNIFTGLNGQGKTNILEAIFFSLRGYSFRTQSNQDLIRKTEKQKTDLTRISMDIQRDRIQDCVQSIILDHKKIVKLNDKPVTGIKLVTEFPVILFSPDSLSAIKDGPDQRRELMNEMLLLGNPQSHRIINEYQKALRARNRFLRNHKDEPSEKLNHEYLGALSENLFKLAIDLIEARKKILTHIQGPFTKSARAILKDPYMCAELGYLMSDENVLSFSKEQIEEKLHVRRLELYDAELASGTTLWGPHKHDLSLTYGGNPARYFCSQGQQRALILALKISQIVHHFESYGKYPILLLDDVFSELDRDRRTYLLDFLSELKTQSILTSTDVLTGDSSQSKLNASIFEVSNGSVESFRNRFEKNRGDLVRTKSVGDSAKGLLR